MQVIVKPTSATLSHDTELFSRMSPYVICVLEGSRQKSKAHNLGGKQPKWNDTLIFNVNSPSGMIVQVWDDDFMFDDFIGEGHVDLSAYFVNPGVCRNENVVLNYKGKRAGMINLSIQVQGAMGMGPSMCAINNGWENHLSAEPMNPMGPMGPVGPIGYTTGWGNGPINTCVNNGWGNGPFNNPIAEGIAGALMNNGWGNIPNNGWGM